MKIEILSGNFIDNNNNKGTTSSRFSKIDQSTEIYDTCLMTRGFKIEVYTIEGTRV